ncbi:MAG TPA: hypothetical protein VNS22_22440 [Geminicoccus sp.]|uniref:hypothetical protein n=1 Tax=Geminicoccus sp. TaxID=2024832 RepID=UPI002CBAAD1A|nr:hypothetical protein [Geminicoccus sp.]HWL71118.1 hypothetical protein [Geminicoccus sp.]
MNAEERLRWLGAQIVAGELRITRQLEVIRHWRQLGQDTARLEQLLHDMERLLHRWRQHRQGHLARLARAEAAGASTSDTSAVAARH